MLSAVSSYFCPTRIHLGVGASSVLTDLVREHGATRVLLLADAGLLGSRFLDKVSACLAAADAQFETFSDIEPEPSVETVQRAHALQQSLGATLLVVVGGGSAMDAAKAVGILATNGGKVGDYEGMARFSVPPLPLIAVPSTAGTGSEVSGSCVITDAAAHRKMSIRHPVLNPARHAILDPEALVTAPGHIIAHAGIDAFVHAFESYISKLANPFTDAVNLYAIELISQNLRPLFANRANLDAGLATLCGSALAGMAFGQTGLGNVHCMARFVGARFNLSHGLSNALCLPQVARFNLVANPVKFARLARAMGADTSTMSTLEAARLAIPMIEQLCADVGIPSSLKQVGVDPDSFESMADDCMRAGYEKWNPRQTTREDFVTLFRQAYEPSLSSGPGVRG